MPKLRVAHPNAGPVVLEVPGFGAFMNGQDHEVSDEWVERWMAHHTRETVVFDEEGNVTGLDVQILDLPLGFELLPGEHELDTTEEEFDKQVEESSTPEPEATESAKPAKSGRGVK